MGVGSPRIYEAQSYLQSPPQPWRPFCCQTHWKESHTSFPDASAFLTRPLNAMPGQAVFPPEQFHKKTGPLQYQKI